MRLTLMDAWKSLARSQQSALMRSIADESWTTGYETQRITRGQSKFTRSERKLDSEQKARIFREDAKRVTSAATAKQSSTESPAWNIVPVILVNGGPRTGTGNSNNEPPS